MQKLSDELNQLLEKVYVYANQRLHENTDNSTYQNLASQAQGLLVEPVSYTHLGRRGGER